MSEAPKENWKIIAQRKREALQGIPKVAAKLRTAEEQRDVSGDYIESLLSPGTVAITRLGAEDLLPKLASGEVTAVAVTEAFIERAGWAHVLVSPPEHASRADC